MDNRRPKDPTTTAVPALALFDLDNTLIDRAGAFHRWACAFAKDRGLGHDEVAWLEHADDDGLVPRSALFDQVRSRYDLDEEVGDLVASYREGYPRFVEPVGTETLAALDKLRRRGWKIGIVTNGEPTQEAKIRFAGLLGAVDGWVISQVVGARKPDPAIFAAAAHRCGCTLEGAWIIGDSAKADVAGAVACGLPSIWIRRGREWNEGEYRPDAMVESVAEAVEHLLGARRSPVA